MDLNCAEDYAKTVFLARIRYEEGLAHKHEEYDEETARSSLRRQPKIAAGLEEMVYLFRHLTRKEATVEQLRDFLELVNAKRRVDAGVPEAEALDPLFSRKFGSLLLKK